MFKFRLESVLKYRQFLEDQKLAVLAEKTRIFEEARAKARELKQLRSQYFEAMREESAKEDVSITYLSFYQSYIFFLDRSIERQNQVVARALAVMQAAQQELIEAKKQKEVMLRLKERALEKYRYEEERQNQLILDDNASIKFIRTRRGMNQFAV